MRIFATEYTDIDCSRGLSVDIDLFSVDLVVALDGDVECLFSSIRFYNPLNPQNYE